MRFRCIHCGPPPGSVGWRDGFLFESGRAECPKCGRFGPAAIVAVVDVHFLVEDRNGPILGQSQRFRVACQPKRDGLAMHAHDAYSASGDVLAVTCRSCKGTRAYLETAAIHPLLAEADRIQKALKADCCG